MILSKKYRLLFYCHQFYPQNSGYSNAFLKLITSIIKYHNNISIDVVTLYPLGSKRELDIKRVRVFRIKKPTNLKFARYFLNPYFVAKNIDKIYKNGNYDLLFVETFDDIIMLSSLSKYTIKKTVVRIHATYETEYRFFFSDIFHRIDRLFATYFAKKLKYIASTNSYHIGFFKKYYLRDNPKLISEKSYFVIPNSSEISDSLSKTSKSLWNTKDKIRLITVGRMNKGGMRQKGMGDLFDAFVVLKNRCPETLDKFEMIVIGDGEYKKNFKKIVKDNSLDFINFVDSVSHDDLLNLLKTADVSILASRFEGLSMFAVESLATSNVVLFSKTGGLIDLVDNNGYFFEPEDVNAIADAIEKVSGLSKKKINLLKKNSRELFDDKFNETIVVNKFYSMLNKVVG